MASENDNETSNGHKDFVSEEGKQGMMHAGVLLEQPSVDKDWIALQGGQQVEMQSN